MNPLLIFFTQKMAAFYYHHKKLSLDESMVLWRGRLVFHQYIKNTNIDMELNCTCSTEKVGIHGAINNIRGKGYTTQVDAKPFRCRALCISRFLL